MVFEKVISSAPESGLNGNLTSFLSLSNLNKKVFPVPFTLDPLVPQMISVNAPYFLPFESFTIANVFCFPETYSKKAALVNPEVQFFFSRV